MPKTTRTFIALPIPPPLGEKLKRLQTLLAPMVPAARWTSTLPFHLTLAFLGDVHESDLNAVCRAVEDASIPFPPFELHLDGVGAFPNPARPRVLWAGLTGKDLSTLNDLQRSIVKAAASTGYRPDDARFTPHTTLGRIKSDRRSPPPSDLTPVLEPYHSWSGGTFTAREVVTFASSLAPDGPVYTPLSRAPLAGKKTGVTP
jgi:2'-5' RNA ligase